jgi:hypothetical protein
MAGVTGDSTGLAMKKRPERVAASGNAASDLAIEAQRTYTTSGKEEATASSGDSVPELSKWGYCLDAPPEARKSKLSLPKTN